MNAPTRIRTTARLAWIAACVAAPIALGAAETDDRRIRPYEANPRYWQYEGRPVLLVGGTKDDSLFQIPDLAEHLALLHRVGGNFVRNTMSDRRDHDFEVYPFAKRPDGKYDLERWNEEYWRHFDDFLKRTAALEIFVQIEVWDRFDYSQQHWEPHPYRPVNNVNYTTKSSGLANQYPAPAWRDRQPFFHTIPGMPRYDRRLDIVRRYQERFVTRLLSYSLPHGHVLYCMNNETSTPPAWGRHWIALIEREAARRGVSAFCTDMFNDGYEPARSPQFAQAFDDAKVYEFLDLSQINSRIFGEEHWRRMRWVFERTAKHVRPINHVKIYGSGETKWGSGKPADGVERFWRNLFAGCAAVRFHRDGGGTGLQPISQASIRAVRKLETVLKLWRVEPHQELLRDRSEDEAYLVAEPGERYALYLTEGGSVGLDLAGTSGLFRLRWIAIDTGEWAGEGELRGGGVVTVGAPSARPHVAVVSRSRAPVSRWRIWRDRRQGIGQKAARKP